MRGTWTFTGREDTVLVRFHLDAGFTVCGILGSMFLELGPPLLCQGAVRLPSSQNTDSGVQSDQKAPSLKVSELHHFILGIPRRRPLGKGKGCRLEPLTRLWVFLLTFWAPSPPLRSHSPISCSVEKGLSFIFSFLRPSPSPAPRCETLQLASLQLARPGWTGVQARLLALHCWHPSSAGLRSAHIRRAGRSSSWVPCTCLRGPVPAQGCVWRETSFKVGPFS